MDFIQINTHEKLNSNIRLLVVMMILLLKIFVDYGYYLERFWEFTL